MSDAEKSLDIRINMPADTSGGKQAEQSLGAIEAKTKQVTAAVNDQNVATQRLNKTTTENILLLERQNQEILKEIAGTGKLSQNRNREAEAMLGKTTEQLMDSRNTDYATVIPGFAQKADGIGKIGEAAGKAEPKIRGLGYAFSRLGLALGIPGIGRLATLFGPLTIGALAAANVIKTIDDQIKSLAGRSTPDFERLTESIEHQRQAMEEVELAARSYDRALARLASARITVQEDSANHLNSLKTKAANEGAINDDNHERQNATLEAYEAAGLITHQQMLIKKFALDEEYAKKRIALEQSVRDAELKAKVTEADALLAENQLLETRKGGRRAATKKTAADAVRAADTEAALKKDLEKTVTKSAELQQEEQELSGFHPLMSEALLRVQRKQNQDEQVAQLEIAEKLRKSLGTAATKKFDTQDAAKAAAEEQAADEARLHTNTERYNQLQREMPAFQEKTEAANEQAKKEAALKEQTTGLKDASALSKSTVPGFDLEQLSYLEQRRHTFGAKPLNDNENKTVDAFEKLSQSLGQTEQQMLNILYTITGSQSTVAQKLAAYQHEFELVWGQIKDLKNP